MSGQLDENLNKALDFFRQGNLPQSELYARRCLARDPDNAGALSLLKALRRGYGISDSFELSENAPRSGDVSDRFLLIKGWGFGFWSEVHHLVTQLLVAELTHRTPIVLWGANCLFRRDGDVDAFGHFFQNVSAVGLEDIPRSGTIYPAKWNWGNLYQENNNLWEGDCSRLAVQYLFGRPETLLVSDFYTTLNTIIPWIAPSSRYFGMSDDALYAELFQKYLRPVPRIAARVDEFFAGHMQGRPWIAVHMRGSDKIHESPDLVKTNAGCFQFIDRVIELNPLIGVFLLTDSQPMLEEFTELYGDRLLCTEAARSTSNVGVHMSGHDGVDVGEEVLLDALLAIRCDYFVGSLESNVALAISSMRNWQFGFCFMVGVNIRRENPILHLGKPAVTPRCRLCNATAEAAFSSEVLFKYPVTYHKCSACGSLQTETPYWLEEAYSQKAEQFDTGKASRTLSNVLLLQRVFEIIGVHPADRCADFGGGTGLFARLMRDLGYNYYTSDKYGDGEFCAGWSWAKFDRRVKLVTIFECAEHFEHPDAEWDAIFATGADFILGTTGVYTGQGADWSYLSPETGQHLFFYSPAAISLIASKRRFSAYIFGGYFLLARSPLSERARDELKDWQGNLGKVLNDGFREWRKNLFEFTGTDYERMEALARLRRSGRRIALDGVFFRFATGISRMWRSLLAEWSANGFGEFLVVIDRVKTAPRFAGISYVDAPQQNYADLEGDRRMLQEICDREGIGLFTSTYYSTPVTTQAVLMVPDMIPEIMEFDLSDAQWREKHRAIGYCRNFLAISNSTANDLVGFFPSIAPEQVVTAYCGSDFRTPSSEQVLSFKQRYGIDRPYFLISGVKDGYKNALLFFRAFARLGERRGDYAIVCTNSHPVLEPEFAQYVGDAKLHLLILSDVDLQCAFAGALALCYPSRYEGFGLPVLEAMACSCPVITCSNSSIVEVGGDAVIYVDPDDPEDMEGALKAVQDANTRSDLIGKGLKRAGEFTWRRMADKVEAALTRWTS